MSQKYVQIWSNDKPGPTLSARPQSTQNQRQTYIKNEQQRYREIAQKDLSLCRPRLRSKIQFKSKNQTFPRNLCCLRITDTIFLYIVFIHFLPSRQSKKPFFQKTFLTLRRLFLHSTRGNCTARTPTRTRRITRRSRS